MKRSPFIFLIFAFTYLVIGCHEEKSKAANFLSKKKKSRDDKYDSTIFEPLYNTLYAGQDLPEAYIDSFAKNSDTRSDLYDLLESFGKENQFPSEFMSFEKAAESRLTTWLEYPTELDTVPSRMELIKKIDHLDSGVIYTYYIFKFKTDQPHWAAKDGWMVGVAGPYLKNSKPYDWTKGTFSRFSKINETTPEEEVKWTHDNVYKRNTE